MEYELSLIAWAIGGGVGVAAAATGGRGMKMAVMAAVLALVSILGGKLSAAHISLGQYLDTVPPSQEHYDELMADAALWANVDRTDDMEVAEFIASRGYADTKDALAIADEDMDWFLANHGPRLLGWSEDYPSFEEWSVNLRQNERRFFMETVTGKEDGSLLDLVLGELEMIDLLFVGLGVVTAFQLVMRASL